MVVLGVDAHKHSHTVGAVNELGQPLQQTCVRSNDHGHEQMMAWAYRYWPDQPRIWAIEDCRHVTGRLERALLAAGEQAVRVPPKLTVLYRRTARSRGKTDPIDAVAIARAGLTEPDLPVASHDETSRAIKLLVDHREHLVVERTRVVNRLRWHLHRLEPDHRITARTLHRPANIERVHHLLTMTDPCVDRNLAEELLSDVERLTRRIDAAERDLHERINETAPDLLALPGCAHLTAAKIVAETAGISRFRSGDAYAAYTGTAPIPASSGNTHRNRLARGGNRQLNAALHRIAVTQTRLTGAGQAYYRRRQREGHSTTEALRALKRKIARAVYQQLKSAAHQRENPVPLPSYNIAA